MQKLAINYTFNMKGSLILFLLATGWFGVASSLTNSSDAEILRTLRTELKLPGWSSDPQNLDPCNIHPIFRQDWYFCGGNGFRKITSLNIINTSYTGTPPTEIKDLDWLQGLYIEDNPFTPGPPPDLSKLRFINEIRLINSSFSTEDLSLFIQNIPNRFQLWHLILDSNPWRTNGLLPNMSDFQNVTTLSLQNCNIVDKASSISLKLPPTSLRELYLDGNQFTDVMENMTKFQDLTTLSLRNCRLSSLHSSVFQLPYLQKLYLDNNEEIFSGVGNKFPTIKFGSKLTELSMANCGLNGSIDGSLYQQPKLQDLRLRSNQLSGNIASLQLLTSLEYLDLSENRFTSFRGIERLSRRLTTMNLSYNRFEGPVPTCFSHLPNLQVLDLRGNRFDSIPPTLIQKQREGNLTLWVDQYLLKKEKKLPLHSIILVAIGGFLGMIGLFVAWRNLVRLVNAERGANLSQYKGQMEMAQISDHLYLLSPVAKLKGSTKSKKTEVDVVLFHGPARDVEMSKEAYWQDWMTNKGGFFPSFLVKRFPYCRVHAVSYDAGLIRVDGSHGQLDKFLLAENLETEFILSSTKIGQTRPVVLIGHSTGGNVINKFLEKLIQDPQERVKTFLQHLAGVYYFSTPHAGMDLEALVESMGLRRRYHDHAATSSPLYEHQERLNSELARLNGVIHRWHQQSGSHVRFSSAWEGDLQDSDRESWACKTYRRLCCPGRRRKVQVVTEASARAGPCGTELCTAEEADHFTVCKLEDVHSSTYQHLEDFIRQAVGAKNLTEIREDEYPDTVKNIVTSSHSSAPNAQSTHHEELSRNSSILASLL